MLFFALLKKRDDSAKVISDKKINLGARGLVVMTSLEKKGVKVREILLEVGYGTYKEIKDDCIRKHIVDEEEIEVGVQHFL